MPAGHRQFFCLDMAHLSDGPGSLSPLPSLATGTEADGRSLADLSVHMVSREAEGLPAASSAGHARDSAGSMHGRAGKGVELTGAGPSGDRSKRGGSRHGGLQFVAMDSGGSRHGGSLYTGGAGGGSRHGGNAAAGGGSRHGGSRRGGSAYATALLQHQASMGGMDSSSPFAAPPSSVGTQGGLEGLGSLVGSDVAGDLDQTCEVPTTVASSMFKKTLSLARSTSGLVVASYQLEPSVRSGSMYSGGAPGETSVH